MYSQTGEGEASASEFISSPASEDQALNPRQTVERSLFLGENSGVDDVLPAGSGSDFFTVLRIILVLGLAAAAIYGVIFFIKRSSRPQERRDPFVRVLSSVHIGSNRYILVVLVGAKAWLVGAGEGGVSLISEIDDKETLDAMILEDSRKSAQAGSGKRLDFAALLKLFGGGNVPPRSGFNTDALRQRRERLRDLNDGHDRGGPQQ
ncbi:MAG: flagellar biosynthetic protein FliO [Treponema sp.]|nr:flagellar biosynthetic protein FliO [Treponema sp.]